ncbi:MAG: short-chain fatty acid transporter, partial [Planctomycetota bacterium]
DVLGELGERVSPMPLTETILSPLNLVATGGLLLLAPLVMALLHPHKERQGAIQPISDFVALRTSTLLAAARSEGAREEALAGRERKSRFVALLEDTPLVNLLLILLIGAWAIRYYFPAQGPSGVARLTPDTVNLTMLLLGLALHGSPMRYVRAVEEAARGCAGIILQFPLYAGVMGMMHESGLTTLISQRMADLASHATLPLYTFLSAAVVNLFIPSGGGQWGVQGPIAVQTALDAGVEPARMVMAVAYGDQLTNMLQPFWALPLLAVTGVKARDIVGYTAVLMVIAGLWLAACLLVF